MQKHCIDHTKLCVAIARVEERQENHHSLLKKICKNTEDRRKSSRSWMRWMINILIGAVGGSIVLAINIAKDLLLRG